MQETITYRFNHFKSENIGAILTLSKAIRGMQYGKQKVIDAFNKLILKGEYAKNEKEEIINDWMVKNFNNENSLSCSLWPTGSLFSIKIFSIFP